MSAERHPFPNPGLRRMCYQLLDRSLLLGEPGGGVKMHDIIREEAIGLCPEPNRMRQQRRFVELLIQSAPSTGYQLSSELPLHRCAEPPLAALRSGGGISQAS